MSKHQFVVYRVTLYTVSNYRYPTAGYLLSLPLLAWYRFNFLLRLGCKNVPISVFLSLKKFRSKVGLSYFMTFPEYYICTKCNNDIVDRWRTGRC